VSVVLSILKIIGIILLVILCIILALLLIVLFVPIRYGARAVKEEQGPDGKITDGLRAQAGVSWLAHIISFKIAFEGGKLSKGLKIFGIDLSKRKKQKAKKKKKKTVKEGPERPLSEIASSGEKKEKAAPEQSAAEEVPREEITGSVGAESGEPAENDAADSVLNSGETAQPEPDHSGENGEETSPDGSEPEGAGEEGPEGAERPEESEEPEPEKLSKEELKKRKREAKEAKKAAKARAAEEKKQRRAHRKKADSFTEFLWRVAEAVYNVFRKIAEKIKGVIEKLKAVFALIEKWMDFLDDDRTQKAIALALKEVGGILKGILPKKVKGYVRFGHDDPSKTGQQLAYLAAAYPLYGKNLDIYPDFEKKALEGDIELKGRIFLATIVWAGLKLILNKNIKYVIGFVRNKEDKANGGE